jgi:integrase/recombinase XerD
MRNQRMKQPVLQSIHGEENEIVDSYNRVNRNEEREEYVNCLKPLGL